MRVLAISGSLRKGSTNTAALEALARLAPDGRAGARLPGPRQAAAVQSGRRRRGQPKPEPVAALRAIVGACDAIVIAAPEYAHGVPGVLKNALDWLVASETFAGKRVVLINASPRAFHAQANLREILSTMAARLLADAFVTLPLTGKAITAEEIVGRPDLRAPARPSARGACRGRTGALRPPEPCGHCASARFGLMGSKCITTSSSSSTSAPR